MTLGLAFWIIMLLWFIFGAYAAWSTPHAILPLGHNVLVFLLFLLLGWQVFGAPLKH